jgi:hypothetical protein
MLISSLLPRDSWMECFGLISNEQALCPSIKQCRVAAGRKGIRHRDAE